MGWIEEERILSINPLFLFVLFSMGYVFGLLLKNPTSGKFLIFGFAGIFVYEPVRDAGLFASAVFVAGIISHHITPFSILDRLPRLSHGGRSSSRHEDNSGSNRRRRQSKETADETHDRYAEYVNKNRGKESRDEAEDKARRPKRKTADAKADVEQENLRREKDRLKREEARLKAERERFAREQREKAKASEPPPDNRTDEQILGISGKYSLADLKKARNAEVKRWNTSNMVNKPPHLIQQAEEEAKKINLAYDRLVTQFRT